MMSFSRSFTGGSVNGSIMSFLMQSLMHCVDTTMPEGRSTAAGCTLESGRLLSGHMYLSFAIWPRKSLDSSSRVNFTAVSCFSRKGFAVMGHRTVVSGFLSVVRACGVSCGTQKLVSGACVPVSDERSERPIVEAVATVLPVRELRSDCDSPSCCATNSSIRTCCASCSSLAASATTPASCASHACSSRSSSFLRLKMYSTITCLSYSMPLAVTTGLTHACRERLHASISFMASPSRVRCIVPQP
mmetsp:Transcript_16057/g.38113  ORF Transcript_16057/g.38113 Transcript_16057/m.38113 type:complete len:245 (-) Transcript_16057:190-924(-)